MRTISLFLFFSHEAICFTVAPGRQIHKTNAPSFSPLFHLSCEKDSRIASNRPCELSSITMLRMSDEKNEEKHVETTESDVEVSNEMKGGKEKQKERSGLLTALIIGPPLVAKFGIVLLVKFLTDLVVFPLLFLYRMCKILKNKVLGLFIKDDLMKGDKVNGSS